jgi:hypothetical protein
MSVFISSLLRAYSLVSIGGFGMKVSSQDREVLGLLRQLNRPAVLPNISSHELKTDSRQFVLMNYISQLQMEVRAQTLLRNKNLSVHSIAVPWAPKGLREKGMVVPNQTVAVIYRCSAQFFNKEDDYAGDLKGREYTLGKSFNTSHGAAGHLERLAHALVGMADLWVLCARDLEDSRRFDHSGVRCSDYAHAVELIRTKVPVHVYMMTYDDSTIKTFYPQASWSEAKKWASRPISYAVHGGYRIVYYSCCLAVDLYSTGFPSTTYYRTTCV